MPQLSTTSILVIYIWTWFTLSSIIKKIKTTLINKTPTKMPQQKPKTPTPQTPWT